VEGKGEFPLEDAVWNTATKYRCELKYPNKEKIIGDDEASKLLTGNYRAPWKLS